MRKLFIVLVTLILIFAPASASAQNDSSPRKIEVTTLKENEVVNKDYFAFNERVEIFGTVNGDVYVGGGIVVIEGKINGDLIVAGGQVFVSGEVGQDARVGGGQVIINGKIAGNLTVGAGSLTISSSANVAGSAVIGAGSVELGAAIGKDLKIGAGSLTLSNQIGGGVEAWVGSLRLSDKAHIGADLSYWSDNEASIAEEATITGKITKSALPAEVDKAEFLDALTGLNLIFRIISLTSLFILGVLLLRLFPVFNGRVVSNLRNSPWKSFGVGLLGFVAIPLVAVIMVVTIVALPLGLSILPLFVTALLFSRVFAVYLFGKLILERFTKNVNDYLALLIGLIVFTVVTHLPVIGGVFAFLTILGGFGALLITKKELYDSFRQKKLL